ncbi:MAG: hypothetical protein ACRDMV_00820 [Streptosporangiales bacterium]
MADTAWQAPQAHYRLHGPVPAWQSIPGFVRLAVWVWAISVIVGLIAAVISFLFFLLTGAALLGGLGS